MVKETVKWSCPKCNSDVLAESPLELAPRIKEHKAGCPGWQEEKLKEEPKAVAIYDAATGELARREAVGMALAFAKEAGIKPELGHLCLYHGRPWITIQGWYYLLRQRFPKACLTTRPLKPEERELFKIEDKIHAWVAEVYEEEGGKKLATGYGYASADEPLARGSAVEPVWVWRLAEKRSEEDCIRKIVGL